MKKMHRVTFTYRGKAKQTLIDKPTVSEALEFLFEMYGESRTKIEDLTISVYWEV